MPMNARPIIAALAVCAAACPGLAAAQPVNCGDLYNRLIALYQSAPQSPAYAQMAAAYQASCVTGSPTQPGAVAPGYAGSAAQPGAANPGGAGATTAGSLPMLGSPSSTEPSESHVVVAPGGGADPGGGSSGGRGGGGGGHK
jgi:hypothetical protein